MYWPRRHPDSETPYRVFQIDRRMCEASRRRSAKIIRYTACSVRCDVPRRRSSWNCSARRHR